MEWKKFLAVFLVFLILIFPKTNVYADDKYDMARESGVTAKQLESALYYDLSDYASTFVLCEEEFGINSVLLSSIAALESGWARSDLAKEKNNLFGWRSSSGEYSKFESKEQCILNVAKSISENYLDESGPYYSGGTMVENVAEYYSPSDEWVELVKEIVDGILERCDEYEGEKYAEKENEGKEHEEVFDDSKTGIRGSTVQTTISGIEFQLRNPRIVRSCKCRTNSIPIASRCYEEYLRKIIDTLDFLIYNNNNRIICWRCKNERNERNLFIQNIS